MGALEIIRQTIEEHRLIPKGAWVVVGFSGGPDSLCLLHCLWRLQQDGEDFQLYGVHVNHRLRGEAAEADEAYARSFCEEKKISFASYSFDVARMAEEQGLSTEDTGRRVRYEAFDGVRSSLRGISVTAVAQNANDQAETVLMRLMRGTGIRGLAAMDYCREGGVVRPLLNVTRQQVEDYCREQGLEPRIDLTNLEPDYTRNRIRLELIPYMSSHFNPSIIDVLRRLADHAREEASFVDQAAEDWIAAFLEPTKEECSTLSLPLEALTEAHLALRHRIVFKLFARLGLDKNIGAVHLKQADALLEKGEAGALLDFPQGYRLERTNRDLHFLSPGQEGAIGVAENWVQEEWNVRYELQIERGQEMGGVNPVELPWNLRAFAGDALRKSGFTPVIRGRRPGDFIRPLGAKGTKKIQDFFVDKKVPQQDRDTIPLVCLGPEVIWIAADPALYPGGGTISETYKLTKGTTDVVLLRILRKETAQGLELQGKLW